MCGGGGDQTVTTRTELDPEVRRHLYGGSVVDGQYRPVGYTPPPSAAVSSVSSGSYGPDAGVQPGGFDSFGGGAPSQGGFGGSMSDHVGSGAMYAMGGPVQTGIASMQPNMPMTQNMPMMNGMLPNLSNPEIAATLAMAQMRPQMMAGMGSQGMGMPQQGFAIGGMIEGPGTGTSDSIPATIYQDGMPVQDAALSDGEFVMTERAVRGAGNGDREAGAARMYEMMQRFERGGRV